MESVTHLPSPSLGLFPLFYHTHESTFLTALWQKYQNLRICFPIPFTCMFLLVGKSNCFCFPKIEFLVPSSKRSSEEESQVPCILTCSLLKRGSDLQTPLWGKEKVPMIHVEEMVMTTSSLPVNSPKNFLQTSLSRGRMFSFSSSLVRWMPSSSRVLGRLVSTSPTTCDRNRHHVSSNDSPSVVVQRTRGAKGQEEGSLHWVLFYRESSWQGYQFGFREIFGTYTSNQQWV